MVTTWYNRTWRKKFILRINRNTFYFDRIELFYFLKGFAYYKYGSKLLWLLRAGINRVRHKNLLKSYLSVKFLLFIGRMSRRWKLIIKMISIYIFVFCFYLTFVYGGGHDAGLPNKTDSEINYRYSFLKSPLFFVLFFFKLMQL